MNERLIITFDKSQEDVPVLMIFRENQFAYLNNTPMISVVNTITGNRAVEIWNELNHKKKSGFADLLKDNMK